MYSENVKTVFSCVFYRNRNVQSYHSILIMIMNAKCLQYAFWVSRISVSDKWSISLQKMDWFLQLSTKIYVSFCWRRKEHFRLLKIMTGSRPRHDTVPIGIVSLDDLEESSSYLNDFSPRRIQKTPCISHYFNNESILKI